MTDSSVAGTCIDQLAADIGRLRRRHPDDWLIDRISDHIETLASMLEPTAAQLAAWTAPGDEAAVTEAIRIVDERAQKLRRLLGEAA